MRAVARRYRCVVSQWQWMQSATKVGGALMMDIATRLSGPGSPFRLRAANQRGAGVAAFSRSELAFVALAARSGLVRFEATPAFAVLICCILCLKPRMRS